MQTFLVALVIIAALFYVVRRLFNSLRPGASSCDCGCSGCSNTGCVTAADKKSKQDKTEHA